MEISKHIADCIMPNNERTNYNQLTGNWAKQYCQASSIGPTPVPSQEPDTPAPTPELDTAEPTEAPATPQSTNKPDISQPTPEPASKEPPLPTLKSMCAATKCKSQFETCMNIYDSCACYPGQLSCVQINCPDDWDISKKDCIEAIALAESCVLTCDAGAYPDSSTEESTVVMTVVSSIALSGLKMAEFKAVENKFKSALADTLSVSADKINITNITEVTDVSDRRLLSDKKFPLGQGGRVSQRRLKIGETRLNIEFEVAVSSVDDLKAATSILQGRTILY